MSPVKKKKATDIEFVSESTYGYLPNHVVMDALGIETPDYESLLHGSLIYDDDDYLNGLISEIKYERS